jgi:hypothetical protein
LVGRSAANSGACVAGSLSSGERVRVRADVEHTFIWINDHLTPALSSEERENTFAASWETPATGLAG